MITEERLAQALEDVASSIEVPADGPDGVRRRIAAEAPATPVRPMATAVTPRRVMIGVASLAALVALVVGIVAEQAPSGPSSALSPSPPPTTTAPVASPPTPAFSRTAAGAQADLGLNATPQSVKKQASPGVAAKIVATGTLRLVVGHGVVASTVTRLSSLASSVGGYVSSEQVTSGTEPGATVVFAVPAGEFSAFVAKAQHFGTARSIVTNANDVTTQYVDLSAQISALVGARNQLETFLTKTKNVSELLNVEEQIQSTQTQIDELVGQQKALQSEISYSRLTVVLTAKATPPKPPARENGFKKAIDRAWSSFVAGLRDVVGALGDVAFVLVLLALVALVGLVLRRTAWQAVRRRNM